MKGYVPFRVRWPDSAPEYEPNYTLDRQIAEARELMGEDAWVKRQAEWSDQ